MYLANSQSSRRSLFGIEIDALSCRDAADLVYRWMRQPDGRCRYVVTPNVDHLVQLRRDAAFRAAYAAADLITPDGMPIVWASRFLGRPLPQRVTGADLVPAVFDAANTAMPLRVFLLGAAPGVAEQAAVRIHRQWAAVEVVGLHSPAWGFERSDEQNEHILSLIAAQPVDLLVVGLGAPKQECWVHRHQARLAASVAMCVGATIDFLAGQLRRAPGWMQSAGLEWLFRLRCEPRRLAGRYLRDAWHFPRLVASEFGRRAGPRGTD